MRLQALVDLNRGKADVIKLILNQFVKANDKIQTFEQTKKELDNLSLVLQGERKLHAFHPV